MALLTPLNEGKINTKEQERVCESCGKSLPSSQSINFIGIVGSPGHPSLPAFQCTQVEHWSCSIECWSKVAHACIDEHLHDILTKMHESLK